MWRCFRGMAIMGTVLGLNLLAEGLRDGLDVRTPEFEPSRPYTVRGCRTGNVTANVAPTPGAESTVNLLRWRATMPYDTLKPSQGGVRGALFNRFNSFPTPGPNRGEPRLAFGWHCDN